MTLVMLRAFLSNLAKYPDQTLTRRLYEQYCIPFVTIQTSPEPVPAVPPWFGKVIMVAHSLRHLSVLSEIKEDW
jgi:hypothetical protein